MAHTRPLSALSLAVACAMLLCVAVTQSRASPTIPQIKAELKKCRAAMAKLSDYKAYLQGIDEMLKRSPADMKGLFNTTLLIPTNKGLYALGLRTLTNMTAMTVIGQYNVLTKRYTSAQLAKLAPGAKIRSVLRGVPIQDKREVVDVGDGRRCDVEVDVSRIVDWKGCSGDFYEL
ncbi:unnamed protein product [Closterium sp. Naga37s-1]|nr:unnamed protein product [Closterium sp. Naga37s-1]